MTVAGSTECVSELTPLVDDLFPDDTQGLAWALPLERDGARAP